MTEHNTSSCNVDGKHSLCLQAGFVTLILSVGLSEKQAEKPCPVCLVEHTNLPHTDSDQKLKVSAGHGGTYL